MPEICLSVNHSVTFEVWHITELVNRFVMCTFLLVLLKCVETEEQVERNELLSGRFEQDVSEGT